MAEDKVKRRLAAILAADIAGYSRLMGKNEAATVRDLKGHQSVVLPLVGEFGGRIIDTAGDGILAEFPSALGAVECAIGIQNLMAARNQDVPDSRRMQFRMGINLGDVIHDETRIYGDGINVAARLENIAEPGGICVSSKVYDEIVGKLALSYRDLGELELKNIARRVRVYVLNIFTDSQDASDLPVSPTNAIGVIDDKTPSIAILPFADMSKDGGNEYFADGLAEELLNVLSRIPGLRVASRTSAFSFKGKNVDIPTIAKKLNVANILEGSVRTSGKRVRVSAQLIRVATDSHLWSNTYDRDLEDIFAVQDDIAKIVVKELAAALPIGPACSDSTAIKVETATLGRSHNLEAYRLYLQGRYFTNHFTREDGTKGLECLLGAVELDADFALGWAGLSRIYTNLANDGFMPLDEGYEKSRSAARRALELEPALPEGHASLGRVQLFYDWDWASAGASFRRALELAPGNADVARHAAVLSAALGRSDEALMLCRRAVLLDPLSVAAHGDLGMWCVNAGLLEEAETALRTAHELNPQKRITYGYLGLVQIAQGKPDEALANFDNESMEALRFFGLAMAHHDLGQQAQSDTAMTELRKKVSVDSLYFIAAVYAYRGEADSAFEWLERAFEKRAPSLVTLKLDFLFRRLHQDPRWPILLQKLKVA